MAKKKIRIVLSIPSNPDEITRKVVNLHKNTDRFDKSNLGLSLMAGGLVLKELGLLELVCGAWIANSKNEGGNDINIKTIIASLSALTPPPTVAGNSVKEFNSDQPSMVLRTSDTTNSDICYTDIDDNESVVLNPSVAYEKYASEQPEIPIKNDFSAVSDLQENKSSFGMGMMSMGTERKN
jgi:hypothetical protein